MDWIDYYKKKQEFLADYYMNKERKNLINPHIDKFLIATFTQVSEKGIDATLTKKNIKELYNKYCVRMEN